jgi:hypothetical protein
MVPLEVGLNSESQSEVEPSFGDFCGFRSIFDVLISTVPKKRPTTRQDSPFDFAAAFPALTARFAVDVSVASYAVRLAVLFCVSTKNGSLNY